jgi:hypothetical protein
VYRLATLLTVFFLTAGGAAAKGPPVDRIDLCGSRACVAAVSGAATEALNSFFVGALTPVPPAAPQPYYDVRSVYAAGGFRLSSYFVAAASALYGGDWNTLDAAALAPMSASAERLEPWPEPGVIAATIAGRAVHEPASYIRLFTAGRLTSAWHGFGGWLRVEVLFDRPNPWAMTSLRISRKRGFVWREGWIHRIPDALAARARRGLSLTG